jgi:NOL1/NOP2/fmu family ribosome biogenesis protein
LFYNRQQEYILAMPLQLEKYLAEIQSALYIKKAGTMLGVIIRNELIPAHDLAVSTIISADIPAIDVDLETALQYLRKQEMKLETNIKGWALIRFKKIPSRLDKSLAKQDQ